MYTVQEIASKEVTTRFGPKPSYKVKASGEWFNFGFKKPTFSVGDNINFSFTEGKYGKDMDPLTVKVISSGDATGSVMPSAAPPARSYGPPTRPFPIPALHGDRAIVRQNALTNARELWCSRNGQLSDGGVWSPEAEADAIIKLAKLFEAYSAGDSDLEEAMKEE